MEEKVEEREKVEKVKRKERRRGDGGWKRLRRRR